MKQLKKTLIILVLITGIGVVSPRIAAAVNQGSLEQFWREHHKPGCCWWHDFWR